MNRFMFSSMAAAAALLLLLPGTAVAQRSSDVLGALPPPGTDLDVRHYFPSGGRTKGAANSGAKGTVAFKAGEVISVVVGARNTGSKPVNLSAIVGAVTLADDRAFFVQNLTLARYLTPLAPGREAALEYRFRADPSLGSTPARDWGLVLHLLYEAGDGARFHTQTFLNATAEVADAPRLVDYDLVWLALTLAALAAGGAYAAHGYAASAGLIKGGGRKAGGGKGAGKRAAPAAIDEDDWVRGTHYDAQRRRKLQQQRQQEQASARRG